MALKTTRNEDEFRNAAKHEIMILEKISKADPEDTSLCIKMLDWFEFQGHICIVFEALGLSLSEFGKKNYFNPLTLDEVRHIVYQLCHSVNYLHRNGITHTDLKPDNILLVTNDTENDDCDICTDVRLIDFGNAELEQQHRTENISTRYYRAPEVMLQLDWSHSSDVRSIGCILYELCVGEMLFLIADDTTYHLAVMEIILGKFPQHMKVNIDWDKVDAQIAQIKSLFKPLNENLSESDVELLDLISKMH